MKKCLHCHVAGRVQGVSYRAATQAMARSLRLTGHAGNLPDGRVEVIACGEEADLQTLEKWLWTGPALARVSDVACTWSDAQDFAGFQTR